jgi:ribosomal protein S18 acetylase RimI-like enzyme
VKSSNIIVRYATDSDLPAIERHHGGRLDRIGDPFCDVAHIQNNRLDWLLIAELDGKYAGFLYWHLGQKPFFASEVEKFAHIRQISVLEEFQGQGIAKKLMVYATERLKALRSLSCNN